MKTKSIFLITLLSLFVVSGLWAQVGERVYINEYTVSNTGKTTMFVYEKGEVHQFEIDNAYSKKVEYLKSSAEVLEKYFKQGYKLIGTTTKTYCTEYILEKQ